MKKNLHNIQESGFKVPKDYFKNLEETILSHASLKEKVNNAGFIVPKNYFESVENDILTKAYKKKPIKTISLLNRRNIVYMSGIASTILLLFNLSIFNTSFNFDSLETETVDSFIINNFEVDELAILFTNTDLNETNFIEYTLSEETLDYYLETLEEAELILE